MVGWEGKGFQKQDFCRKGLHPMSGDNIKVQRNGKRHCKICAQAREKRAVYIQGVRGEYREKGDSYYEIQHPDLGCPEVSPSCFTCPLAECKYDNWPAFLQWKREKAALEIIDLQADGYTNLEVCEKVGVIKIASLKQAVKLAGYAWEGGRINKGDGLPMCSKNKHVVWSDADFLFFKDDKGLSKKCKKCKQEYNKIHKKIYRSKRVHEG